VNENGQKLFIETTGPKREAKALSTPLELLLLLFTEEIIQEIVVQSNLYYSQSETTKVRNWTDITVSEMKAFLGIILAMGMVELPDMYDYWCKTDPITCVPWFANIMPRDRFVLIMRFLHLSDKTKEPPRDSPNYKLYKIGNLYSKTNENFLKFYKPDKNLSIDEQMIGTRCRVGFIQYMPKKPKKFGIKLWALCEAKTGYCCKFQVYTGKVGDGVQEKGLAYRVVFDLMDPFLDKNHNLFIDNFYTGVKLLQDLETRSTYTCGTIRRDRGVFPPEFQQKELQRGEAVYLQSGNLVAVHWKDFPQSTVLLTLWFKEKPVTQSISQRL